MAFALDYRPNGVTVPLIVTRMVIPTVLVLITTVILGMAHIAILAAIVGFSSPFVWAIGLGMALHSDRMGA